MPSKGTKTATKKKVNKSKEILAYYKKHPDAKPREIVAALKRRKVDVNAQYVSTILFNHRRKTDGDGMPASEKFVTQNASSVSGRELILAKQLVKQSGSLQAAKKALDLYGNIIA